MSKHKDKPATTNSKALELKDTMGQTLGQVIAKAALMPAINAAYVVETYQGNILGKDADMNVLVEQLSGTFEDVKGGDLHTLEAMLIGQATALQTIFTSLALRAHSAQYLKHIESVLGLALKAQAQSRATISALVDLKYPRQATFVKQANIAHGPQQVNNASAQARAEQIKPEQNELLEDASHDSTQLDTRATAAPARSHTGVETVAQIHRAAKRQR